MLNSKKRDRFPAKVYLKKALVAAVLSSIINAILFEIGNLIGAFPQEVIISGTNQPMAIGQVIFASAVSSILGILVYWILGKRTVFLGVALVILLLSMATPFTISESPLIMKVFLMIMHLIVGGVTMYVASTTSK